MSQPEDIKINVEKATEKLQDVLSLIIVLENDLSSQESDEIHLRTVKVIHEMLNTVKKELSVQINDLH